MKLRKGLLLLACLFCWQCAMGQYASRCSSDFLETFDLPFADCTPTGGLSASCHSRYSHQNPSNAGWVASRAALPAYDPNDPNQYFTVDADPLGTNWLTIKPASQAGTLSGSPGQNSQDAYLPLWSKELLVPANKGGRFTVDVPTGQRGLWASLGTSSGNYTTYLLQPSAVETVASGVERLVFTIPDAPVRIGSTNVYWGDGNLTLYLRFYQHIDGISNNCSNDPTQLGPACTVQAEAIPYFKLDNISFRPSSVRPDFIEPFDLPFADCTPTGGLSASCHSRYSHQNPSNAGWVASRAALPAYDPNDPNQYFTVDADPLGTNWLTIKPASSAGAIPRRQGQPAEDAYLPLWSKELLVPANKGGRFTVDVPTGQRGLWASLGTSSGNYTTYLLQPSAVETVASGVERLVFTIPDAPVRIGSTNVYWGDGNLTLYLRFYQHIDSAPSDCDENFDPTTPNPTKTGQQPCTVQVSAAPYFKLDNISFTSNGQVTALGLPSVTNLSVCAPGSIQLSVNGTQSGVSYVWYDSPAATIPFATGATVTTTVSNSTVYYVQALPGSRLACPSDYQPVTVTIRQVIQPTITVPNAVILSNAVAVQFTGQPTYSYSWDWGDGSTDRGTGVSHTYTTIGTYTVQLTIQDNLPPLSCSLSLTYQIEVGNKLCEIVLPAASLATLTVKRSNRTGSFVLSIASCPATTTTFACLTGQAQPGSNEAVAASALALTDAAPAADPAYALLASDLATNPFLSGAGRLRPEATYSYATPIDEQYAHSTERGRFSILPFNWQVGADYRLPVWRRAGQATRYSPDGQALEEQDILLIPSAVKLGYQGHSLPYLTAKNASYRQVLFESFERQPNSLLGEDAFTVSSAEAQADPSRAHAGSGSLELKEINAGEFNFTLPAFPGRWNSDVQLKLWLRISESGTPEQALSKEKILTQSSATAPALIVRWTSGLQSTVSLVAQTGDWILCEATLKNADIPATGFTPQFVCIGSGSRRIWIDDVRLQPLAAQMSAYVYDWSTLKLLASFDDQHFGLYYQYNAEGKLVRKQVETERGLRTIQETQYNLPQP